MMLEIPLAPPGPNFTIETTLDGVHYGLTFRWNDREGTWYLDLTDINGNPIISGRKLVEGTWLLRYVADRTVRPPGELVVQGTVAQQSDLGGPVKLFYIEAATLEAFGQAGVTAVAWE